MIKAKLKKTLAVIAENSDDITMCYEGDYVDVLEIILNIKYNFYEADCVLPGDTERRVIRLRLDFLDVTFWVKLNPSENEINVRIYEDEGKIKFAGVLHDKG